MQINGVEIELRDSNSMLEEINTLNDGVPQARSFYPELAKLFKSRDIATFVSQVEHHWLNKGRRPFYKFTKAGEKSRDGDSWTEELSMSYYDVSKILGVISTRVQGKANAEELARTGTELNTLVVRYQAADGNTYWYLNEKVFLNLRVHALQKHPNKETKTEVKNLDFQESQKNELSSYSEHTHNIKEKEKEKLNKKEKEKNPEESLDDLAIGHDVTRKLNTAAKKEKNMAVASKPKKPKTPEQLKMMDIQKKGAPMSLDFEVKSVTIDDAVKQGFVREQVEEMIPHFLNWYKNTETGRKFKALNWDLQFLDYLDYQYKKGKIQKNGQTKPSTDANKNRVDRLRDLATGSIFDKVGTRDFAELGRRLRERGN